MCGIVCYWAREALLTREQYDILLTGAEQRGQDGIGVSVCYPHPKSDHDPIFLTIRVPQSYSSCKIDILDMIEKYMIRGAVLIASCRATPETEPETDIDMIQPIFYDDMLLSHNGGVTESIRSDPFLKDHKYKTKIDSEMIIAAYTAHGRNMKKTMEFLSGSFAFVFLDGSKEKLYAVTSFNPLAHMYIRGYGYFYHSDNEVLGETLVSLGLPNEDGANVWESWYHHYLNSYTIIETDLQSGAQSHITYKPRFLHPIWNALIPGTREKTYVVASGGIDSGLTTHILRMVGRDVSMIHFHYGQKAEDSEAWAIRKLSDRLQVPYLFIDLHDLYRKMAPRNSMLIDDDIPVTSGGDDLKSTIAWVSGRNALFAAIVMAHAESAILKWNYKRIDIAAGWAQLSEETGGYPDNSFYFQAALQALKSTGYITGSRIEFLPVLQRVTKTGCWKLGDALGFPFELTVSCDNPVMKDGVPHLCQECGSTKLSMIAADRANVYDKRMFTTTRYKQAEPTLLPNCRDIIDRLMLTEAEKEKLKGLLK